MSNIPPHPTDEGVQQSAGGSRSWRIWRWLLLFVAATAVAVAILVAFELRTSWLQSRILTDYAKEIFFTVEDGPSPAIRFPSSGPYDERLGYTRILELTERLNARGFETTRQARFSQRLLDVVDRGLFPVYREKSHAGLRITDRLGHPVFVASYPDQTFAEFKEIPPVLTRTLLHIENRALLNPDLPYLNPAVEWDRLARAALDFGLDRIGIERAVPGASTLATQIEKFRHSPGGVTDSPEEKLRQVATASLRVYLEGRNTLEEQRRIVLDYLNSVPLSGIAGYGEVNGLKTGLRAWYAVDPVEVMELLNSVEGTAPPPSGVRPEVGRAYRAVLSLLLAQSRPSYYLATEEGRRVLAQRTEEYLRILGRDGVISRELARAADSASLSLRLHAPPAAPVSFVERKGANALRTHLLALLGEDRLYGLDRWDLEVESSLDQPTQVVITDELLRMADPAYVGDAGLAGPRLVSGPDPGRITYTFLLLESTERGNVVRVQADNFEGPLDLNEGGLLELGSTAKLRALVTYLEMVEELYNALSGLEPSERERVATEFDDPLTAWAVRWLAGNPGGDLSTMLDAAMERTYSANPSERFFTGGGIHTFSNFDATYNSSVLTVSTAFRQSVNLPFIRLMRDLVRYQTLRVPGSSARALAGDSVEVVRQEYLSRFADREGRIFIGRFFAALRDATGDVEAMVDRVVGGRSMSPQGLARIYRAVHPEGTPEQLGAHLRSRTDAVLSEQAVADLYRRTSPDGINWPDLGYLAGVHPLELWVARYLADHPEATRGEVIAESADVRQEVYRWLFTTRRRSAQDQRIQTMLELEAFQELSQRWRRLGYPFPQLVPSYATAIGSSGDRPTALAELVGILLNDGIRRPAARVEWLRFAEATPYETELRRTPAAGTRVLSAEVAAAARGALLDVVENGTARRVFGALTTEDATPLPIGGKTGTGDNRSVVVDARGRVIDSRVMNRTSTFVFFLGDRFYGVVTAYVDGPAASEYRFTSALPTQLLRHLSPTLEGLVVARD